jgi:hypothetical protein
VKAGCRTAGTSGPILSRPIREGFEAMAQRTIIQLTDDLDGKPIPEGKGETIRFSLDASVAFSVPGQASSLEEALVTCPVRAR